MSMKPGATISPCASTTRRAGPVCRGVMPAMRPSRTATSARTGSAPVPSRTMPPRTTRSSMVSGLPRERNAGMTSRAKRVSCSTIRSRGVPIAQPIMTWSSPG